MTPSSPSHGGIAELLRHQRIQVVQKAIIECPSFSDLHKSPSLCALDLAKAVVDALHDHSEKSL